MTEGGCLCGALRYTCDEGAAVTALHCHCKDCQRVTGSGKTTVVMFPDSAVSIRGDYKTFSSLGTDGSHVNRGFCGNCGSQLFTFVDEIPGHVFIKAGTMDSSAWLTVDLTCWASSAPDWLTPDSAIPAVPQNPPTN